MKTSPKTKQKLSKTYYLMTLGCQMNQADSERLAAFLDNAGFKRIDDYQKAGIVIVNTCGIRQPAEERAYNLINRVHKYNPKAKVILAGCLSKRDDVKDRVADQVNLFLPINELLQLPEFLQGEEYKPYLSLDSVRLKKGEKYLDIEPRLSSKFSAYVPIGNGCNNFCSYCVVPYARGREVYRKASKVITEVKKLIAQGYKEIILIAQNVNSYRDGDYDFPRLLSEVAELPGNFWVRFASSHPKDLSDGLIEAIGKYHKICPHLHLAVQSGDNKILKAMNRRYTAGHYKRLIAKARAARPGISITTDVIVGFPKETEKQFKNTVKLFQDVNFDLAYISRYSPRPGTVSAKMKDNVTDKEKKRRAGELNKVLKKTALANNKKHLGQVMKVLVEGVNKSGHYYGKAAGYQTVVISDRLESKSKNAKIKDKKTNSLIGDFVLVKIAKARAFGLEGSMNAVRQKPKALVILGPTASGKTDLGVSLARIFGGEIVGADSRQVYRGLDVGSGKDLDKYKQGGKKVSYHLIDVASPKTRFDLAKYQKKAFKAMEDIIKRNKLPIVVGGSGLYLQALVDNYDLSDARPKTAIRKKYEKRPASELMKIIRDLKPEFAARINNSDKNNARRLARYLEIINSGGQPLRGHKESGYDFLVLGIKVSDQDIRSRIKQRVLERLEKQAMVAEVKNLHDQGLSWQRLESFGLEYKFISEHLRGDVTYQQMIDSLVTATYRFAKRQKTWFKRWEKQGQKIEWITKPDKVRAEVDKWLSD